MPQLDFLVFSLEIFYNSFYFLLIYFIIVYFLTPRIFFALRNRSRLHFWLFRQQFLSNKLIKSVNNFSIFLLDKLCLFNEVIFNFVIPPQCFNLFSYNFFAKPYLNNEMLTLKSDIKYAFIFFYEDNNLKT